MDIVENGLAAGGSLIEIGVVEDSGANRLEIRVCDNGRGIPADLVGEVTSPFYTTRTTRTVGLGLSLLREAAKRCNGGFLVQSQPGKGTEVRASFERNHIDRAPMGDVAGSLTGLIMGNPEVDFIYRHEIDGRVFSLDTREIRKELEDVPINHPRVLVQLAEMIRESIAEMGERHRSIGPGSRVQGRKDGGPAEP
jgi:hypothetical protein